MFRDSNDSTTSSIPLAMIISKFFMMLFFKMDLLACFLLITIVHMCKSIYKDTKVLKIIREGELRHGKRVVKYLKVCRENKKTGIRLLIPVFLKKKSLIFV